MSSLIAWILRAIPFGTIIMYGALGETLTEKSGNLTWVFPVSCTWAACRFCQRLLLRKTQRQPQRLCLS